MTVLMHNRMRTSLFMFRILQIQVVSSGMAMEMVFGSFREAYFYSPMKYIVMPAKKCRCNIYLFTRTTAKTVLQCVRASLARRGYLNTQTSGKVKIVCVCVCGLWFIIHTLQAV